MAFSSFNNLTEWMKFYQHVTEIYPNFFTELLKTQPSLKHREVKLCALFLFECESLEIEQRMGMSTEAVITARSRLKKKLKLKPGQRLIAYLQLIASGQTVEQKSLKVNSDSHFAIT